MKKRIVLALGGNAILSNDASADAQKKALQETSSQLSALIKEGHEVIISHGNGPQVGNLLIQQKASDSVKNPAMPLDTCVAMTQGSIGYWLQNALCKELSKNGINKSIVSLITQVVVDKNDKAFTFPTKPIGPFLTEDDAKSEMAKDGSKYIEDSGRGWRKVVPSPKPIDIVEAPILKQLLNGDNIIVCCGGGGIPVIKSDNGYDGIEAVIDKDLSTEKLSELIDADIFLILTGVDNVFVNYNKPNQLKLEKVNVAELEQYIKEEQFAAGSMLPKIEAAIEFVKSGANKKAIITSLENLSNIGKGVGTEIVA